MKEFISFIRDETGWSEFQLSVNRCMNAVMLRDRRLSGWEVDFLKDLYRRGLLEAPGKQLSVKQGEIVCRIAAKVFDGIPF